MGILTLIKMETGTRMQSRRRQGVTSSLTVSKVFPFLDMQIVCFQPCPKKKIEKINLFLLSTFSKETNYFYT